MDGGVCLVLFGRQPLRRVADSAVVGVVADRRESVRCGDGPGSWGWPVSVGSPVDEWTVPVVEVEDVGLVAGGEHVGLVALGL